MRRLVIAALVVLIIPRIILSLGDSYSSDSFATNERRA
jgi:hypothetical protein